MANTASITFCLHCGIPTQGKAFCCAGCESLANDFSTVDTSTEKFNYLDQPNFKEMYRHLEKDFDYYLYVEGIHCSSCVHLIEKLNDYDQNILEARVNYPLSQLAIKTNLDFSLARLAALLSSWGYTPHYICTSSNKEDFFKKENKKSLIRLGVAGACAGNIMLFVIPVYSGLQSPLKEIFNWLSFILFLPVLFYAATPFYQGALNSLRYRVINVDLPITIAFLSSFIFSLVNLVRGNSMIYFDSTASFVFLILCARHLLKNIQYRFDNSIQIHDILQSDLVTKVVGGTEAKISLSEIKLGDILKFERNAIIPVDGKLLSEKASLDVAVLNGEPLPQFFEKGLLVIAGSKILSSQIEIEVTQTPNSTYLAKMMQQLQDGTWVKTKWANLSDKASQYLIVIVFTAAIIYFVLNYEQNFNEAFNRSLALIVLACPCALAFGTPLTLALTLRKAKQLGILIKDANVLEKVLNLKNIFFDKTGTLTELNIHLAKTSPENLNVEIKEIILGLESNSYHPLAFALRNAWQDIKPQAFTSTTEKAGVGVTGILANQSYTLEKSKESNDSLCVELYKNHEFICALHFEEVLRIDVGTCLSQLNAQGYATYLLTGDHHNRALKIADRCQIQASSVFSSLTPENKKNIVSQHQNSCMIGDGVNDALAMQQADVGIAVQGSTFVSLKAADIFFTRGGLKPLIDLVNLARQSRKVLLRNLTFAFIYNATGGVLALMGFIDPRWAAILMPISSVLIILSTLVGFR